jgi:alpha-tubulin suppressor-like RCC1 family protein
VLSPTATIGSITTAIAVTAGAEHTCALLADGHYRCWGLDRDGELGDGSNSEADAPEPESAAGGFVALAGGSGHTCALLASGGVDCWGFGGNGEIGNGGVIDARVPTSVAIDGGASTAAIAAVAAGGAHDCAIRVDGSVACWGLGSVGQLGNGIASEWQPQLVPLPGPAYAIAVGDQHTCAVANSDVYCWGDDTLGQLGDDGSTPAVATPQLVSGLGAVALAAGGNHTCDIENTTAAIDCWGDNTSGQLGNGNTNRVVGVTLSQLTAVTQIAGGEAFTCGINASGVSCWGSDDTGQLGDGGGGGASSSSPVLATAGAYTEAAAGGGHACAMTSIGQVYCWGRNDFGQVGDGSTLTPARPTAIAGGARFAILGGGALHTCSLTSDGTFACWGDNSHGEIGDGTTVQADVPERIQVPGLSSNNRVAAGDGFSCAPMQAGPYCWGDNAYGQLGDGTSRAHSLPLPSISPAASPIATITARGGHVCLLDVANNVYCWGDNGRGQIGLGTFSRSLTPVEVAFP